MNLRQIATVLLLIFSNQNYSQYYKKSQLDSLTEVQEKQEGPEQINTLLSLADSYIAFQLDTAQLYLDRAREKSIEIGFEWGICKSYFIESNVQFRQGKKHLEEVKFIKEKCANWFKNNNFIKDALLVKMSRNKEVLLSEGRAKAFENAELFLKQARKSNDPLLQAKAWGEINDSKNPLFSAANYPESVDSLLFYLNKTKDSLKIFTVSLNALINKHGVLIPKSEIMKIGQTADRWNNPMIFAIHSKMKVFPFFVSENIDSSTYYLDKMNQTGWKMGDSLVFLQTQRMISIYYTHTNDYSQTVKLSKEIAMKNEQYGIKMDLAFNFQSLGESYFSLKKYDLAISNFLRAINLFEKLDDHYMENSIKRRLADLYVLTGENKKAECLYEEAIEWAIKKQEFLVIQIMLANTHHSIALLNQKEKKYDKALLNYQDAIDALKNASSRLIWPKIGLMSLYLDMDEIEKADSMYFEISSMPYGRIKITSQEFYFEEGRLFLALKKNNKAIKSLHAYLDFAATNAINEEKKEANFLLYTAYKSLGQDREALSAFETFKAIEDSLESGNVKENVRKIQSDYELSLKESEIERLEQQQEISDLKFVKQENELSLGKLYITLLIFSFLMLGGMGYFLFRRLRYRKEEEKKEIKKRSEIEKLKARQKTELVEVKNNLYANISHEFKTPLTLIRVPIESFKMESSEKDKATYDSILRNTDYLLEMLNELLEVSKIVSDKIDLHPTSFNIARLLSQIKLDFLPLFTAKNIQLNWIIELDQDHFYGDENRLNIVINNLLKNAYSNTSENGWLTCKISLTQALKISVSNKGEQINSTDLPHVFERFYRASDNNYTGSGIGLAWTKQIVELHNGTIQVDNSKKDQVTFCVKIPVPSNTEKRLPIADTNEIFEDDRAMNLQELNPSQENLPHILVVEDNLEMQKLLGNILKSEFRLNFAENGQIGEDMAIQLQPDLVLSDVMMPEKDGFELLKSLKENFNASHIPVVLLTARADSTSRVIGLNQDADDYIEKPFKSIELIARINNLLRQRRHLHKLFSENPLLYSKEIKCTPIDRDFIDRARKILEVSHSDGDFSVNEFCRELALNKTNVNDKLKALTHQTIAEYIKNFRLDKAANLLIETNLTISEISTDTGFNTIQVFNKAFKKKFEFTPSMFRSKLHNE